jgi:far upstream element-binding protein
MGGRMCEQNFQENQRVTQGGGTALPSAGPSSIPGVQTIVHMVPSGHIGTIIGRGGDAIKSLQSRTGARVQVDKNVDQATDRALTITGRCFRSSCVCLCA